MARKPRVPKAKKQRSKRVSYELIKRDSAAGKPIYGMVTDLVEKHHEELTNARIAVAWNLSWRADVDGVVKLGQLKKASDLDRELHPYDFVIMLRKEFFELAETTDAQRLALIDHELSHGTVRIDKDGEPMVDAKGRTLYRMRKHDVEEFSHIVARHGLYKRDLEHFFSVAKRNRQGQLVDISSRRKAGNGQAGNGAVKDGEAAKPEAGEQPLPSAPGA